jgi:hypothetical protein
MIRQQRSTVNGTGVSNLFAQVMICSRNGAHFHSQPLRHMYVTPFSPAGS